MKIYCAVTLILLLALLTGCHNTGRQVRKTVESTHDLLLEGSY
jgi:predicted small secreted protein